MFSHTFISPSLSGCQVASLAIGCQINCHVCWLIKNHAGGIKKTHCWIQRIKLSRCSIYVCAPGMLDLVAIKNSFIGNTLPLVHLHLPYPLSLGSTMIFSMVSLFLCVTSLHYIGVGCDSPSLSFFVHTVSLFLPCLLPSPVSLFIKNLAWNRDRRVPAVFFWRTLPFLNQNQLRQNQVITLAGFLLFAPSHSFFHWKSMKFYSLKRNRGQPVCWMKGSGCIHKH